jgi:hypothetical protein
MARSKPVESSRSEPKVRLSKLKSSHVRIVEILRYLYDRKGVARLDHIDMYRELARRGVLDPMTHIIRSDGGEMPTANATHLCFVCVRHCLDMGLIQQHRATTKFYSSRKHVYMLTFDGRDTLLDWDDNTADGLWI